MSDLTKLRGMWEYVSGMEVSDELLQSIEGKLRKDHPAMAEQDYKYNLALRMSDTAHKMMKSQH